MSDVEIRTITDNNEYIFWLKGDASKLRDMMRVHWDILNRLIEADELDEVEHSQGSVETP